MICRNTLNNARHRKRRRGVFLIEMVVVVALMAIVALVASQIMSISFKMQREARLHEALVTRVDNAVDRMRRDVWSAKAIRATDTKLDLDTPDGTISWEMSADGILKRTRAGSNEGSTGQWDEFPAFHFSTGTGAGASLVKVSVNATTSAGLKREELTLISPLLGATP